MQRHVCRSTRTCCFLVFTLVGCATNQPIDWENDVTPAATQFVAQSGHSPPFARIPYEPFTRAEAVAVAEQEWRLFGQRVDDDPPHTAFDQEPGQDPDRLPGLWERIGE